MKKSIPLLFFLLGISSFAQDSVKVNNILAQLNIKKQNCKFDLVTSKVMPNKPEETIYVIPEIVSKSDYHFELNSYILITNTETAKIKYMHFESSETNEWYSDAIELKTITIDTAPYYITDNKRAFGIRVFYEGNARANPYNHETISLYALEEDKLMQVLNNFEVKAFNGEWDTTCDGEFVEANTILIVTDIMHNGYFDITAKATIKERNAFLDENEDCIEKEIITNEKRVLRFEGGSYKLN